MVVLLLPAAGFLRVGEILARVGRSGSKGKPAVETKAREAVLSLSLGRKRRQTGPPILHAAQECWSCWCSAQVSNDFNLRFRLFHACSCLWRSSSAASRRRSSSAHGAALAITSRTIQDNVLCAWAVDTGLLGTSTRDGEFYCK